MSQSEIRAKVHNPQVTAKITASRKVWLESEEGLEFRSRASRRMKRNNPMATDEVRARMTQTLRDMGHGFTVRGGNGTGPTECEQLLLERLPKAHSQFVIPTRARRGSGWPTHYKIDLAFPKEKLAVEVDGVSHSMPGRKAQDRRKDRFLRSLGWTVLRVTNRQVTSNAQEVYLCITSTLKGIRRSR